MKSIKNIFILAGTLVAITHTCGASVPQYEFSNNLEVFNESDKTITVIAEDGQQRRNQPSARTFTVKPGTQSLQGININNNLSLTISDGNMTTKYSINAPGKTKYVTWNTAKEPYLYPQTGLWGGLRGATLSGMPLKNNIAQANIVKIGS